MRFGEVKQEIVRLRPASYSTVDSGRLDIPGGGDRPVFPSCGGLVDGPADEKSAGDPCLDDGDQP